MSELLTPKYKGEKARPDPELRENLRAIVISNLTEYHTADGLVKVRLRKMLDQFLALIKGIRKQVRREVVSFIESYLVTTVHPEGNIHHIDDNEWQSIKQRLLGKPLEGADKENDERGEVEEKDRPNI